MTFWVIVIIIAVWLIIRHYSQSHKTVPGVPAHTPAENDEIKEETVFKVQTKFEKDLMDNVDLPDAIGGRDAYIYRNLMAPWYAKLAGQYRYDEKMTQQLRNDWLDYMSSLGDRSTYNYLSLELDDEAKKESYREDHITASRKVFAIEDGFAAMIGKEAVDSLAEARNLSFGDIDRHGNRAPEGQEFDFRGELRPKKKK